MTDEGIRYLATALAVFPLFGVALALGKVFGDWLSAVGRNPGAADRMQGIGLLGFALTEAVGLLAMIVAFLILFAT
ncbi:MAG: ATP synthase subunit C family protein [Aestuariivirga sp.]|jgi:F0F1-type ATP synthase membrane subunit c/vacuolar-type H+-ATPase subunit K